MKVSGDLAAGERAIADREAEIAGLGVIGKKRVPEPVARGEGRMA